MIIEKASEPVKIDIKKMLYDSILSIQEWKMHKFVCTNSVPGLLFGMLQYMNNFRNDFFSVFASVTNRMLRHVKHFLVETDWMLDRDAVTMECSIEMSAVVMTVAGCLLPNNKRMFKPTEFEFGNEAKQQ